MEKNAAIEILQVANGFIVRCTYDRSGVVRGNADFVFQSFRELSNWLSEHFDHRIGCVLVDFKSE